MSNCAYGFQMSRYLQERACYVGQSQVYEESSEQLKELLGVEISGKQIERVCHCYGKLLKNSEALESKGNKLEAQESQKVYGMADGSMVFTREEGWKEVKLGRLFTEQSHQAVSKKRHRITESVYTAHLGGYKEFLSKWELEIPIGVKLILLADGAKWFWDWAKENHPEALQILDYYHCKEYLCEFAKGYFKTKALRDQWIDQQEERLFNDKVAEVIDEIKALPIKALEHNSIKKTILTYYENNHPRMLYGTYRKKGLLIGSGPIEAAHRNVIQQRLKLAGQRWTKPGAQSVANLRVCRKSNRWDNVVELTNQKKWAA